jgi:signal transduction histidine kinase
MKEILIMTPEVSKNFERSLDMLDSSIQELRRVAHNMMPESLLKYGLDTALRDFCSEINAIGQVIIDYQSYDIKSMNIEQTKSIAVYRIAQELINNALKHATAKNIVVQLSFTGELLSLTVEDDGKGMQIQEALKKAGMGLRNIQNRVDFIGGHLDIESNSQEGTSIHIEIPIK